MTIVLLAGSSAFGQFIVQPMKVELGVQAGKRLTTKLALENLSRNNAETISLRLVDMSQDPNGIWQAIEPDTELIEDPNGARWVTVGTENKPIRLDIARLRSCRSWLRLEKDVVELESLRRREVGLHVTIPAGTRGYYCAALIAETHFRPGETGVHASVILQFLVPVIIEVQGRPLRDEIQLTDVDLRFQPQQEQVPAATLVTLGIENNGGTYRRLVGLARVWGQVGGHWRKITDTEFVDTGIIPGVSLDLKEDVGRPLPSGKYKVQGFLFVNGRRSGMVEEEIDYDGDGRIISVQGDAALELDPRELTIKALPGAIRSSSMRVINASEETVVVDVEVALPEEMMHAVISDGRGQTVRGDELSCVDWLQIEPKQFTLRGHARRSLKIMAYMPSSAANRPNYYATVRLKSRYQDGQAGGETTGRVYVETRGVEATPRILGSLLTLSESSPERYFVRARFSNSGVTHVLPRCRAALTTLDASGPGMTRKRLDLSSQAYNQTGSMLPCEIRHFSGVLDVSGIAPGEYRLTAILEYGVGGSAQIQKGIAISEKDGLKSVDFIGLDDRGGVVPIEL